MYEDILSVDQLITMLGCGRNDSRVLKLIDSLDGRLTFFIDKENGADDEYLEVKSLGLSLYFDAGELASIFLYSGQKDREYREYPLSLPSGLRFGQSKSEILRDLGSPSSAGGGKKGFFGDVAEWIKYNQGEYALHLEFANGANSVQMVTLMRT
jgi:hypothetical protein